jgi:hypothetical protein
LLEGSAGHPSRYPPARQVRLAVRPRAAPRHDHTFRAAVALATFRAMPKPTKSPKDKASPEDHPERQQLPNELTLDTLAGHLGKPDEDFRRRRLRGLVEADLVAEGGRVDSQALVDDVPGFVGSALAIRRELTPEQRAHLKLPDGYLTLIVDEAVTLRRLKADHDTTVAFAAGGKAEREEAARRTRHEGIALRDLVYDGLRNALGESRLPKLDAIVGDAESADRLAKGLAAIAKFIDEVIASADEDDLASLDEFDVGERCAETLRKKAEQVRASGEVTVAPERQVTQRALDLQDGRVLFLIEATLRAFRAANRSGRSIRVPKLNKVAWMFEVRTGRRKPVKTPPEGTPPAVG